MGPPPTCCQPSDGHKCELTLIWGDNLSALVQYSLVDASFWHHHMPDLDNSDTDKKNSSNDYNGIISGLGLGHSLALGSSSNNSMAIFICQTDLNRHMGFEAPTVTGKEEEEEEEAGNGNDSAAEFNLFMSLVTDGRSSKQAEELEHAVGREVKRAESPSFSRPISTGAMEMMRMTRDEEGGGGRGSGSQNARLPLPPVSSHLLPSPSLLSLPPPLISPPSAFSGIDSRRPLLPRPGSALGRPSTSQSAFRYPLAPTPIPKPEPKPRPTRFDKPLPQLPSSSRYQLFKRRIRAKLSAIKGRMERSRLGR